MNIFYYGVPGKTGYGRAADGYIKAFSLLGNVQFKSYGKNKNYSSTQKKYLSKITRDADVIIHHLKFPKIDLDLSKVNIAITTWEADRLPNDWVKYANKYDAIIVPSEFNKTAFIASGVTTEISVVPHLVEPIKQKEAKKSDKFTFYYIGTCHKRKGVYQSLIAFYEAFKNNKDVQFYLKLTLDKESISEYEYIVALASKMSNVVVDTNDCSDEKIAKIHNQFHCLLSTNFGEGFGYSIADAIAAHNPVIATGYGGQTDYLIKKMMVDYQIQPCIGMEKSGFDGTYMKWAYPDITDTVKRMIEVYENYPLYKMRAETNAGMLLAKCSLDNVTYKLDQVLSTFRVHTKFLFQDKGIGDLMCAMYAVQGFINKHDVKVSVFSKYTSPWLTIFKDVKQKASSDSQTVDISLNKLNSYYIKVRQCFKTGYASAANSDVVKPVVIDAIANLEKEDYIIVSPYASKASRTYPINKMSYVTKLLYDKGYKVKILVGPNKAGGIFWGEKLRLTDPIEIASVIKKSKILVGNESGMAHVAGVVGTKALVISSWLDKNVVGTYTDSEFIYSKDFYGITPEQIVAKIEEICLLTQSTSVQ